MTRYFLETSAHLERWSGDTATQNEIAGLLGETSHSTSSHVEREWKHIVEGGTVAVLNGLDRGLDAASMLAQMSQDFGRRPKQFLRLLSMLTRCDIQNLDDPETRIRGEHFLRVRSKVWFRHQIDILRDGSECELAREQARRGKGGSFHLRDRCQRDECNCRQIEFVDEHATDWRRAGEGLASNARRDADKKMGKLALEVLAGPQGRKGQNCWAKLGDVSIAMECGPDEVLLTTDESFETICPAINIQLHRIRPTPHLAP